MKKMKIRFQTKSKLESRLKYFNDDNLMEVSQKQFLKQQDQLLELQNHLRTFLRGIMDITNTIDNMYSCFKGLYEPNWVGNLEFNHMCQESLKIWRQFIADFKCNIMKAIDDYGQDFPDMKRSIEKRNKKLIELNKQRLIYENYRNAKKIDDVKVKKAELEMKSLEHDYQDQNNILKESLPQFCDKRIRIYVELWTRLFEAEEAMFSFLREGRKFQLGILSKFSAAADTGQYNIKLQAATVNGSDSNLLSTKAYAQSAMSLVNPELRTTATMSFDHGSLIDVNSPNQPPPTLDMGSRDNSMVNRTKSYHITPRGPSEMSDSSNTSFFNIPQEKSAIKKRISFTEMSDVVKIPSEKVKLSNHTKMTANPQPPANLSDTSDVDFDEYDSIENFTAKNHDIISKTTPAGDIYNRRNSDGHKNITYQIMQEIESYYQVRAEFDYQGQDEDELDLTIGDVILVLPWDSEEQMEEGWLFGENIVTKKKGLFPENHTTRLDP